MPYDIAHRKLTVYGDAYDQAETWQWSIRYLADEPASDASLLDDANYWLGQMSDFYTNGTGNTFSSSHRLLGVKAAAITTSGEYPADQDAQVAELGTPLVGANSVKAIPQLAIVITTLTGSNRGLAHQGRFYLAGMLAGVDQSGHMGATQVQGYVDALTDAMNETLGSGLAHVGAFIVASNTRTGAHRTITQLSAGRVIDTHRSRRRSLEELPVTGAAIG